jgi:transposase InsO family protein
MKTICAEEVSELVFKNIITCHGCPTHILTDQGTQFTSAMIQDLCKRFKIQEIEASAYHPQTNGKCERFNRFLNNCLSILTKKDQSNWDDMLDLAVMAYRTTVHDIMKETPFYLLYGRDAILPNDVVFGVKPTRTDAVEDPDDFATRKIELAAKLKQAYEEVSHRHLDKTSKYTIRYDLRHQVPSKRLRHVAPSSSQERSKQETFAKVGGPFSRGSSSGQCNVRNRRPGRNCSKSPRAAFA